MRELHPQRLMASQSTCQLRHPQSALTRLSSALELNVHHFQTSLIMSQSSSSPTFSRRRRATFISALVGLHCALTFDMYLGTLLTFSSDNAKYDALQQQAVKVPDGQEAWNVPLGVSLGKSYFSSYSKWTAPSIKFVIDVPLHGTAFPTTDSSKQFLQAGLSAIGSHLAAVEIGNEPDSYRKDKTDTQLTSDSWTPEYYDRKWHEFAHSFLDVPGLSKRPFQGLALAGPPVGNAKQWQLSEWFNQDDGHSFSYTLIQTVSMHYYQTISPSAQLGSQIQQLLMNHEAIVDKTDHYKDSIKYVTQRGMAFVMGEVGSSLNGKINEGTTQTNDFDLEAVLGSALWTIDWMLYAMSQGVTRISMQQGTGFAYAGWQPRPLTGRKLARQWESQAVSAPYYGYLFVADFIGPAPEVQMQQIPIPEQSSPQTVVAYGAYEGGKLNRVAFINLKECQSTNDCRESTITIPLPPGMSKVTINKMTGPNDHGTKAIGSNMAYTGKTYLWSNHGNASPADPQLQSQPQAIIAGRKVTFSLRNSEAALLTFS